MVNLLPASSEFSQLWLVHFVTWEAIDLEFNSSKILDGDTIVSNFCKGFYSSCYLIFSVHEKQRNPVWVYIWGNV